jgi:mono/diheme cytochrome c family protein
MARGSKKGTANGSSDERAWQRPQGNGLRETGWALVIACLMALPIAAAGAYIIHAGDVAKEQERLAAAERLRAHERLVAAPALEVLPVVAVARGRDLFRTSCAACHAAEGTGVDGLGKDLTRSPFVASLNNPALHKFLLVGRPNATPAPMPPKGGNPDLTDEDLEQLITYVRAIQDPRRMPALPAPTVIAAVEPTADEKAKALAAAGGDEELAEYIAYGAKVFATSCVACHGKDARGVPGNGKDLVNSAFCKSQDDDSLLAFLKKGRDPSEPANTTGVGMPAKGGNPALSDDDLLDVIAFVRSLQTASK